MYCTDCLFMFDIINQTKMSNMRFCRLFQRFGYCMKHNVFDSRNYQMYDKENVISRKIYNPFTNNTQQPEQYNSDKQYTKYGVETCFERCEYCDAQI